MKTLIFLCVGAALAFLSKLAGRFAATVHRTDATGAKWTIGGHLDLIRQLFRVALILGLVVAGVFLVPPSWALWAVAFGLVALVLLNVTFGGLAGTSESLGNFLARARKWDDIEHQIVMKERCREALRRFLVPILAVVLATRVWAGGNCGIAIDETVSVDVAGRKEALDFLEGSIFDYIRAMDCTAIVVIRFTDSARFAKRTWLEAVQEPTLLDCQAATAEPLSGEASFFELGRNVDEGVRQVAVAGCEKVNAKAQSAYIAKRATFLSELHAAFNITPRMAYSPIAETVQTLSRSGQYSSLIFVSDLLDNPRAPLNSVKIPDSVSVLMIAVAPDPKHGNTAMVVARAQEWEGLRNVTVVTATELDPRLWDRVKLGR